MADDSLQSFTTNWVLAGLLLTSLLAVAIGFMYNNNANALNDGTEIIFNDIYESETDSLSELSEDSNSLLNITSNTNPEVSDLGSRDVVSTGFGAAGTAQSKWKISKQLISWVFTGETGKILLGVLGGLMALSIYFLVTKHIRLGS